MQHLRKHIVSFLVLVKFTENMDYYDVAQRDFQSFVKPLFTIFSQENEALNFTQIIIFIEFIRKK